jgi:hypothetical protein
MLQAGVGDQLLRERAQSLQAGSPPITRAEVNAAFEKLGDSVLDVEVPVLVVENEYTAARQARQRLEARQAALARAWRRAWPRSALRWLQILISYGLIVAGVVILVKRL